MGTIRNKAKKGHPAQWRVQIRRAGWPIQTQTFRTKESAKAWERATERAMDDGTFVDRSPARRTTFKEIIVRYLTEITDKRPGKDSRDAERARLTRIMRDETALCADAVANLRPEDFEACRDRRLTEITRRGKPGGRGQYKAAGRRLRGRRGARPPSQAAVYGEAPRKQHGLLPATYVSSCRICKTRAEAISLTISVD